MGSPQMMLGLSEWNSRLWLLAQRNEKTLQHYTTLAATRYLVTCIDTASDVVLTVGQSGELVSDSSKIHIRI